jgi:peroxiredoxin
MSCLKLFRRLLPALVFILPLLSFSAQAAPRVGDAVSFEVTLIGGQTLRSKDLAGRPVLLVFWASWCPPCHAEMAALEKAYVNYRKQGLEIVAVSLDNSAEDAREFLRSHPVSFPTAMSSDHHARQFGPLLWPPRMFVINRAGQLSASHWGTLSPAALTATIRLIL